MVENGDVCGFAKGNVVNLLLVFDIWVGTV